MDIKVINRRTGQIFQEKVYGARWIALFYENPLLRVLIKNLIVQKLVSWVYGLLQRLPSSRAKVAPFVRDFSIDMDRFVEPIGGFKSFDDFFVRQLKPELCVFPQNKKELGSPCEARLSVFKIKNHTAPMVVKGKSLELKTLVGSLVNLLDYEDGHVWVFRLCPVDYHRFHFPDDGKLLMSRRLKGKLHSVNPISLEKIPGVFLENERQLSILESSNFGEILYLEVGAVCVGTIKQFTPQGDSFKRGQEKGAFHFGGSTVVMVTRKEIAPDGDLIENTNKGIETLVGVGEKLATAN